MICMPKLSANTFAIISWETLATALGLTGTKGISSCSGSSSFLNYLVENNLSYEVLGVDVNPPKFAMEDYAPTLAMSFEQVNLLDKEAVEDMIATFRPDYILHLAH